jgi:hypothetical protein
MWARIVLLVGALSIGSAAAQSTPAVPYPQRYQTALVKYAVVDRVDGLSRDLYASRDAVDAMRRDPSLEEFPVGVLFAFGVYRARMTGHDRRTGRPIFEAGPDGHLVRSQTERTLPLMRKTARLRQPELDVRRLRSVDRRAVEAPAPRRLPALSPGGGDERHVVLAEPAEAVRDDRDGAVPLLRAARAAVLSVLTRRGRVQALPTTR